MAAALDLHVWRRAADPGTIEQELVALWAEIGREQPTARAMMSNLVVMKERPAGSTGIELAEPVDGIPLDEIARRHPARIIVVYYVRGVPGNCPPIAAAISVTTFGAAATRYGVEAIAVESRCAESSLPSIIRRLTVGDMPTTLWWADDLSEAAPRGPLASIGRQVLYDSRKWRNTDAGFAAAAAILTSDTPADVADLNWRRLAALRSALASSVRSRADALDKAFRARVQYHPGERALAELVAGWIAARMRWPAGRWAVDVEERRHGGDLLQVTLTEGTSGTITAVQDRARVVVRDSRVSAPIVVPAPRELDADAVAMELASLAQDICLRDALLALAGRQR